KKHGIRFVTFSSDLVFDGKKNSAYVETDSVSPLNVYGRSKAESETNVLNIFPDSLVIRTSAFFGPWDQYNFVTQVLNTIEKDRPFHATDALRVSPTYVPDLVDYSLDLLIDAEKNIWHLANRGDISWYELACNVADRAGKDSQLIVRQPFETLSFFAQRPVFSVLASEKGIELPTLDQALDSYFSERKRKAARQQQNSVESRHYSAA
ncbi:MAG TPA: sugar nucleotide-binding protein, partial [Chitinophagaceae bacterium]|nr:sugar nucleotide-binding protein [Chitinophagaceae bacterium]